MVELRAQELQLLTVLGSLGGKASVEQLVDACKFPDTAVMRIGLTLQEKNLIKIHAQFQSVIKLTAEGEAYSRKGLPERNLILSVGKLGVTADLQTAVKQAGIEPQFVQIALGWAIRKKWVQYSSKDNTLHLTDPFALVNDGCDETLLKHLSDEHQHQLSFEDLSLELKEVAEQLKKRKILTIDPKTTRT